MIEILPDESANTNTKALVALSGFTGIPLVTIKDIFQTFFIYVALKLRDQVRPRVTIPYLGDLMVVSGDELELFISPSPALKRLVDDISAEKSINIPGMKVASSEDAVYKYFKDKISRMDI